MSTQPIDTDSLIKILVKAPDDIKWHPPPGPATKYQTEVETIAHTALVIYSTYN